GYLVGGREKRGRVTERTRGYINHAGGNCNSRAVGVAKRGAPRLWVHRRRGLDLAALHFYGFGAKGGPQGAERHRVTLGPGHGVIGVLVPAIDPDRCEEVDQ